MKMPLPHYGQGSTRALHYNPDALWRLRIEFGNYSRALREYFPVTMVCFSVFDMARPRSVTSHCGAGIQNVSRRLGRQANASAISVKISEPTRIGGAALGRGRSQHAQAACAVASEWSRHGRHEHSSRIDRQVIDGGGKKSEALAPVTEPMDLTGRDL